MSTHVIWLVVSTPLKNISQIGSFPQIGVKVFETTNQFYYLYVMRCNKKRLQTVLHISKSHFDGSHFSKLKGFSFFFADLFT